MERIDTLLTFLGSRHFSTPAGLTVLAILILMVSRTAVTVLSLNPLLAAVLLVLLEATGFLVWTLRRRVVRFKRGEIGVLVSLTHSGSLRDDKAVDGVIDRLLQKLMEDAAAIRAEYGVPVRVVGLRGPHQVGSTEQAKRQLDKSRAAYCLWAQGTAGRNNREAAVEWDTIHSLVRHTPLNQQQQKDLQQSISLVGLAEHRFKVLFNNDITDVRVVSRNLAVLSKYHTGLALAVSGVRDPAIALLLSSCQSGSPETAPYKQKAKSVAAELLYIKWGPDGTWPRPGIDSSVVRLALADALRATQLDPKAYQPQGLAACCHFLLGDLPSAQRANSLMKDRLPKAQASIFHLNLAAFALHGANFDLALHQYRKARRAMGKNDWAVQKTVLEWLYAAVDHLGPAYYFGLGYLNDVAYDKSLAHEQFLRVQPLLRHGSVAANFVEGRLAALSLTTESSAAKRRFGEAFRIDGTPAGVTSITDAAAGS